MNIQKTLFLSFIFVGVFQSIGALSLAQQFTHVGHTEILNTTYAAGTFDSLYACFDEFITFLHTNPSWAQKIYKAKERFIRSKYRSFYSTDFFGFYDESKKEARGQISFYYSTHFHECVCAQYPQLSHVPQIINFLQACYEIQKPCGEIFTNAAKELDIKTIFSSKSDQPPVLLKVVKYLPSYNISIPHYDGTALSLFLDSTDNESLLLSPYKSTFTADDFFCPLRTFSRENDQHSHILIPGAHLTEFAIYPTPHVVKQSGKTRYAAIAFAMRPSPCFFKKRIFSSSTFKSLNNIFLHNMMHKNNESRTGMP